MSGIDPQLTLLRPAQEQPISSMPTEKAVIKTLSDETKAYVDYLRTHARENIEWVAHSNGVDCRAGNKEILNQIYESVIGRLKTEAAPDFIELVGDEPDFFKAGESWSALKADSESGNIIVVSLDLKDETTVLLYGKDGTKTKRDEFTLKPTECIFVEVGQVLIIQSGVELFYI